MILGILTRLATFSLKNPKTIMFAVAGIAIVGFSIHYKLLVGERNKLRIAEAGYQAAVAAFEQREVTLQQDIRLAAEATAELVADRDAQRTALDLLRAGREGDEEAQAWGSQQLPVGEITRLCVTLPGMVGCE